MRFQGGTGTVFIALGSNSTGAWGLPKQTLRVAVRAIAACGIQTIRTSKIYVTEAHAYIRQPDFLNAVMAVDTSLPPEALLQVLKRIEAQAGRAKQKSNPHPYLRWMPRPLDLDIVSYKGLVRNWRGRRPESSGRVILPHPRTHERAFVLQPLSEIAPFWHHPALGQTAAQLLKIPSVRITGQIRSSEDF